MNEDEMGLTSIQRGGKDLAKDRYTIDYHAKVFTSLVDGLVINFRSLNDWTFKTGHNCVIDCGDCCTFNTASNCTFKTGNFCTFNTEGHCTFNTGKFCTFNTHYNCTFKTGGICTFNAGYNCTFDAGELCTFSIHELSTQTFKSGSGIILDRNDKRHYLLNEEFITMQKILKG